MRVALTDMKDTSQNKSDTEVFVTSRESRTEADLSVGGKEDDWKKLGRYNLHRQNTSGMNAPMATKIGSMAVVSSVS